MSSNDYEEEEYIVYVDFEKNLLSCELSDESFDIKIIGIEAEHPIFDVNGKIFKGTYDFSIGTHVFFDKDETTRQSDPLYDSIPEENYKLKAKTNKILHMKRIFLQSDDTDTNDVNGKEETVEELKSKYAVKTTYLEALNTLLPPGQQQPNKDHRDTNKPSTSMTSEEEENDDQKSMETDDDYLNSITSSDD